MADNVASIRWKDNASVYPEAEEIVVALQDAGKRVVVKRKGSETYKHKYPLDEKLANKIYGSIQKVINPEGLTQNITRGREPLLRDIIILRRSTDVHKTDPFFHRHGKDGKVLIISNDPAHAGIDKCIDHFQEYIYHQVNQKNSARTSNDGLRLGCILLDSRYRGSVGGIMSKKKDRKKSDITGDPVTHFFEQILKENFMESAYVAPRPPDNYYTMFPEEEKEAWDPNDSAIFEKERNALWLKATWEEYVRPKYKKLLDRWNKDTGGGDGTPTSFVDYCGSDR